MTLTYTCLLMGQDYYRHCTRPSRSVHPNIIGAGRVWLARLTLDTIERNHPGDLSHCFTECLSQWLRGADNVKSRGGATWDSLSDALQSMNEITAAENLDQESELCLHLLKVYLLLYCS